MSAEILAPAGSFDSLIAAVRCGANAVYLGCKAFNARRNAANFDGEELKKAVDYCHKRNVKVYVTLNTLAADHELKAAYGEIKSICLSGADAFIIQDVGLASIIGKVCPGVAMHASTQMSVQSIYGIEILEEMGFTRAVLPRELSEKEISAISVKTNTELEYFVHGALCMCVSGQCLLSSMLGGRSGNRGLCAQPCRLPFAVGNANGNYLSLKDLSLIDKIPALEKAGVSSLKIEGRMKRPEYVAASVTACRNAINNTPDEKINSALGAVFSRSGFTSGYFDGKTGKEMFGIRTKEDVESASGVLTTLSHLYDNETPLLPVDLHFELKSGEPAKLKAKYNGFESEVVSDVIPSPALNKEITPEDAKSRLSKCGGTQFFVSDFSCEIEKGLNLPVSVVNSLRRDALCALEEKVGYQPIRSVSEFNFEIKPHICKANQLHIRYFDDEQIPGNPPFAHRIIVPLDITDKKLEILVKSGIEIAAEIPVNVFSNGDYYLERLKELKCKGVSLAWACNLDGIGIAKKAGLPFATGFGMNIFNSHSLKYFEENGAKDCLISAELNLNRISDLGFDIPRGVMVYGRVPLMVTRNCPVKNKLTCGECRRSQGLTDRKGIFFPVRCKNGCSFLFNSVPLCVFDKPSEIRNTDYDLIYFTTESADECCAVIDSYHKKQLPSNNYTRGLYNKNIL